MPRERKEFIRDSDVRDREKMFLLAYEGNETEPTYFEAFKKTVRYNNDIIEIVSLRREQGDTKSAPKHVFASLKVVTESYNLDQKDELWMIVDQDRNRSNIEKYFQECQKEINFHLALSNPCFEFWLLLHVKNILDYSEEELGAIYQNRKVSKGKGKRTHLKKLLSEILPDGYNENNIKPERFLPHIQKAIDQAKMLSKEGENYPLGLGTNLFKLVEKIIQ